MKNRSINIKNKKYIFIKIKSEKYKFININIKNR